MIPLKRNAYSFSLVFTPDLPLVRAGGGGGGGGGISMMLSVF